MNDRRELLFCPTHRVYFTAACPICRADDKMIATLESGLARNRRAYLREILTILAAGICAGLAIAGLLVVYGVF